MTPETLERHFDLLTDAPNAAKKLRELVLQLAVQGKLVEQDPSDEPAGVLLERIEAEKKRLIEEKKIRKQKPLPPAEQENYKYNLPRGWGISRLGEITDIIRGVTFPASEKRKEASDGTIACLRTANVQSTVEWDDLLYIPLERVKRSDQRVQKNDIVISMANSYELVGKVAQVSEIPEEATFGGFLSVIRTIELDPKYMMCFLRSPEVQAEMRSTSSQTTNIANISLTGIRPILAPLPPLEEQKRIVAKVDELMGLIDRLEAQGRAKRDARMRFGGAALGSLLSAEDADTFAGSWRRVRDNFDLLCAAPGGVAELRKAVLQLAFSWRLLDHADQTNSLTKGKIKDFVVFQNGYAFKSQWFSSSGIRLVRNANIGHGSLNWVDVARLPIEQAEEFKRFELSEGDIVISLDRPIISTGLKVARISEQDLPSLLLQRVARAQFKTNDLLPSFFYVWLQSPHFIEAIDPGRSNGVPHISTKGIENMAFSFPSIAAQKRILNTVDELMGLIDALEEGLKRAQGDAERLLEAAVRSLLTRNRAASARRSRADAQSKIG